MAPESKCVGPCFWSEQQYSPISYGSRAEGALDVWRLSLPHTHITIYLHTLCNEEDITILRAIITSRGPIVFSSYKR